MLNTGNLIKDLAKWRGCSIVKACEFINALIREWFEPKPLKAFMEVQG